MPPAWSPEKRKANNYDEFNEEIVPESGYVTPPRNSPSDVKDRNRPPERGDQHMKWILQKLPKLASIFKLHRQVGEGTFSAVFVASLLNDYEQNKLFAIKHLVPTTHPKRIQVELSCLKLIGGQDNVVGIDLCLRENENIVFVMPYLKHKQFIDYVSYMDAKETASYMKNLLKAVSRVHSFNIIHRDIKPNNFLYDRQNQKFLLVDFGLAQVCSSSSSDPDSINIQNTAKRKREHETISETGDTKPKDFFEPPAKRPALQKRNINSLNTTVVHLQTTLNKTLLPSLQSKENIRDIVPVVAKKSPFKSPMKTVSAKVMKSPYKFTGLDLPPTHSKFQGKMPGQRRLFMDEEPLKTPIKFQKPVSSMTITSRMPMKTISPTEKKSNQIKQNLNQDCKCYNRAYVCNVCLLRKGQEAPRAGTPGFRPPEVLLKYTEQTTAVDIWAVGVIMCCILSGTYPFFRAPDDVTALAEMITLFGDEQMRKVAKMFGRHLMCSEKKPPLDLRKVCYRLRTRGKRKNDSSNERCKPCEQHIHNCLCIGDPLEVDDDIFPESAYDLMKKLLDVDPFTRITAEEALKHPFLNEF